MTLPAEVDYCICVSVCLSVCVTVWQYVLGVRLSAHFTTKSVEDDIIMAHVATSLVVVWICLADNLVFVIAILYIIWFLLYTLDGSIFITIH